MARNAGERPDIWVASLMSQPVAGAGGQGEALVLLPSSPQPKLLFCLVSVAFLWAGSPPGER